MKRPVNYDRRVVISCEDASVDMSYYEFIMMAKACNRNSKFIYSRLRRMINYVSDKNEEKLKWDDNHRTKYLNDNQNV